MQVVVKLVRLIRFEKPILFFKSRMRYTRYDCDWSSDVCSSDLAIKRVNELDYYSLSLTQLAEKLDLSRMRALALVRHSRIQESDDYFKEITVGKAHFKRYSAKALEKLKADLETVDMGEVWARLGGS